MRTAAGIALDWIEAHPEASSQQRAEAVQAVPAWQWRGPFWPDLAKHCASRLECTVERRPGNALNVEIAAPAPRCAERSPDGLGARWLLSGGSALAYGHCEFRACPRLPR